VDADRGEATASLEVLHRVIVERWLGDLYSSGNLDALDELVTEDLVVHGPGGSGDVQGVDALREGLRWYFGAFTDRAWTVHDVISSSDKVVARYTGHATYRGGWHGIPSTNQRVLETGITIFRVEDGKIQEIWFEVGDLRVAEQLGAFRWPELDVECEGMRV
jgi:steroid delta-isomerase-like uncharacterized protein